MQTYNNKMQHAYFATWINCDFNRQLFHSSAPV